MDDQPPPRKKSRFFSSGKSKLDSANPAKTWDAGQQPSGLALTSPTAPKNTPAGLKTLLQPFIPHSQFQRSQEASVRPDPSVFTPTASAFGSLSVKDDRRQGVHGAQDLLQPNASTARATPQSNDCVNGADKRRGFPVYQLNTPGSAYSFGTQQAKNGPTGSPLPFNFPQPGGQLQHGGYGVPHQARQAATDQASTTVASSNMMPPPLQPTQGHGSRQSQMAGYQTNLAAQTARAPVYAINPDGYSFLPRSRPLVQDANQTIDLDRDSRGNLLQPTRLIPRSRHQPTLLPANFYRPAQVPPQTPRKITPPNYYTSPDRVDRAMLHSRTLKRKRTPVFPPPAYIYTRSNNPTFTIFHGILLYPELCFYLANMLPVDDLISLYSISREFHTIMDTRFTTVMLGQALRKAPESAKIFPFRCYAELCRQDPVARLPHPDPKKAAQGVPRQIPSFKWLRFVLFREKVCEDIMRLMAEAGVPMPKACSRALKKIQYILDIPDNPRRIGFIHNPSLITDLDLFLIVCVFIKLDMRFNDPVASEKRDGMRRLALTQRSLSWLRDVLKGDTCDGLVQLTREWVKWKYEVTAAEVQELRDWKRGVAAMAGRDEKWGKEKLTVFGVDVRDCGRLKHQYWGLVPKEKRPKDGMGREMTLLRPDQLVVRESVKRGIRFGEGRHWLRCLVYGCVNPGTLENEKVRVLGELELERDVEGWEKEDVGEDLLLDLKPKRRIAERCVKRKEISARGRETMEEEEERVRWVYQVCEAWRREAVWEGSLMEIEDVIEEMD